MTWLTYALMTVLFWGVYGILLGMGRAGLLTSEAGKADLANAGLKAFLIVGLAYFVVAVVGPVLVLKQRGSNWSFTLGGLSWSFIAGVAGALGAFTLVLALGAGSKIFGHSVAGAVMPIVFGGAPIVNSLVVMLKDPPEGGFSAAKYWPFLLGVGMAAIGGVLVARFAPVAGAPKPPTPVQAPAASASPAAPVKPSGP